MQRVFLYAYDRQNLGDDLFVHTITKRYPHVQFYMWTTSENRATFRCLPNLKVLRNDGALVRFFSKIRPSLVVRYRNWREKRCRAVVYIGGSIFMEQDIWEQLLTWWEYMVDHHLFYVIGANFGPYRTEVYREKMSEIYGNMQDVCFRDKFSYELFKEKPMVRYAPDILLSYPMPDVAVTKKQIFVSVIDCAGRDTISGLHEHDDRYVKNMASLLQDYLKDGYSLVLASFCKAEGDERGVDKVLHAMGCTDDSRISCLYYDGANSDEMVKAIASSEYVIATRFHAMVLALAAGRPVLPIVYSDKTSRVLDDMGFEGVWFDLRNGQAWTYSQSRRNLENISPGLPADLKERTKDHFLRLDEILVVSQTYVKK